MSNKLGSHLRNLRNHLKKTLRQVEAESGISNAHLSQLEKGAIEKPSPELLKKLSDYYQVELSYLKSLAGYSEDKSAVKIDSKTLPLKYLTAAQLNTFAGIKESEGVLPELVRDLIVSTINLDHLAMPVGNSVYKHGWDGLLNCEQKPSVQFVPQGFSCWEFSRAKDFATKAEKDFDKRTKKPLGQEVQNSTYVQVSFRQVGDAEKKKFVADAKAKSKWKEVIFLDADDLELWLERNPVTAITYARRLGLFPNTPGYHPLSETWDQWWCSTNPPIDESILLEAGKRCDDVKQFTADSFYEHLKIKTNNTDVGIAFLYASFATMEDKTIGQSLISRSMVVDTPDAFRLLATRGKNLILIPTFKGAPIGEAKFNGHRIVSIVNNFDPHDVDSVGRVRTSIIGDFLIAEGGFPSEKAYRVAQACYGNLSVLRLMLADEGEAAQPTWARPDYATSTLPLVMLGGWNAGNEADRDIVKKIAQREYDDVEKYLSSIPENNELLFQKVECNLSFYQEYCLGHLRSFLTDKILENFFAVAKEVLCEINTKYDLDIDKRFSASIYKKGNKYSSRLRQGIATTLAMLATMDHPALSHLKQRVDHLVAEILGDKSDWKFWASLNDIMQLLAEASPEAFLAKVEKASHQDDFVEILNQAATMGGCEYASLLWSLELCAWDRKYFSQVTNILLTLAAKENTKSNYVNKPSNSLWDIYRIWANQSTIPFKERIEILKSLEKSHPKTSWKLFMDIVPTPHESGHYTNRPKFRDIDEDPNKDSGLTFVSALGTIIDHVLTTVDTDVQKWIDLIDLSFKIRPKSFQTKILEHLLTIDVNKFSPEGKSEIWRKIEKELAHHMDFPKSEWSLKGTNLALVKKAYKNFEPKDLLVRWGHIFGYSVSHPEIEGGDDYTKKNESLRSLQRKVLKELVPSEKNINTLISLLKVAPNTWMLGAIFAEVHPELAEAAIKISKDEDRGSEFINGLVFTLFKKEGSAWLEKLLSSSISADTELRLQIFLSLPTEGATWNRLSSENKELQTQYWKSVKRFFVLNSLQDASYAIERFLECNRPIEAFYVLAYFERHKDESIPSDTAMAVLDAIMSCDLNDESEKVDFNLFDYHLENILSELGKRDDVDKRQLALIEWNFLPIFKYRKKPEHLSAEVNRDPSLFIDILTLAYKKDDYSDDGVGTEAAKSRAWDFLHDNKTLPGTVKDGSFNSEQFQKWFFEARNLAIQNSRLKIFESVIGQLFAYSPFDLDDGGWPHKAVRDVFEEFGSDEMANGLSVGIYNKRGVFHRSFGEGGAQERELAKKYREHAKVSEISWPKIATTLRRVAERYANDAHREDVRALHE